uniref:KASH domain-containing protein n=1 Tax=Esox lucius TaxID=8010 RepID=A0AAY5KVL8_ESOLU
MQRILSEIQGMVERRDTFKGGQGMEASWYLEPSSREPEIRLVGTVLRVLRCRYQPAQLNPAWMALQLKQAEEWKHYLLEQVAMMNNVGKAEASDPKGTKNLDGQWSAALLDASATVQIKEAQLHLVTEYQRQTQAIQSNLERWAAEFEALQLKTLGSSALLAERLHTQLCSMGQQKGMIGELFQVCCQVSAHLSEDERSGMLLAQLGELQEKWRFLEGAGNRALRHITISFSQSSMLLEEAEQLNGKLQAFQKSITLLQSSKLQHDVHRVLQLTFMTADLKALNQKYLCLQGKSEAFIQCFLGKKEKDNMECTLQELGMLLESTQSLLYVQPLSIANPCLAKITKQMQDLIVWAKQTEYHITAGKNLSLFPEEARLQIASMRKLQSEILVRHSNVHSKVEDLKALISDEREIDKVIASLKTLEDLYETISETSACTLNEMESVLEEREKMLGQILKVNTWLAVGKHEREVTAGVENVSKDTVQDLESKLQFQKDAIKEAERQLAVTDALLGTCMEVCLGLSPAEINFLINWLTGLRTEVDIVLAHEKACHWELEELIHAWTFSAEELGDIQMSVQEICANLDKQEFPVTKNSLYTIEPLIHMLLDHQCQTHELQYCQETQKSVQLQTIGKLLERTKTLHNHALEYEKYLGNRQGIVDYKDVVKEQAQGVIDKKVSVGERFRLCQVMLVELPLVKVLCHDVADQFEAISQDLHLSERKLQISERQWIQQTVENLDSWELTTMENAKQLELQLLEGLKFYTELPATIDLLQQFRQELMDSNPVEPDITAIRLLLQRCWVIWRNMESGMRVLDALGQREKVDISLCEELHSLRNEVVDRCQARMESLSQARESLKHYHWAAKEAVAFLYQAENMFLSPPDGFLDCTEELRHTEDALASLGQGLQAHLSHLLELAPQQACLSYQQMEQLHIRLLSHLFVERATLEAQVELRKEALQRCADRQMLNRKSLEELRQILQDGESRLSQCAAQEVTSYANFVDQQERAKVLSKDVLSIARRLECLRVLCPLHGCCVGTEGALGALWRRWAALQRSVNLLLAHLEQRGAEWSDVTKSMAQCSSALDKLQDELPEPAVSALAQGDPLVLLGQMDQCQAALERERRTLAFLECRLSQLLGMYKPQEAASPVPVCQVLRDLQQRLENLREHIVLVQSRVLSEEQERDQERIGELKQQVVILLSVLETHPSTHQLKDVSVELDTLRASLQSIVECVWRKYAPLVPLEVERLLQEVTSSLQDMEEKVDHALEKNRSLSRLSGRMAEVRVGLEEVQTLLHQKSPSVSEAERVLKLVWDHLEQWHSRLALLESEVQETAEEEPEWAQLLMDQLTQPLQLYQDTAHLAEQRTAFLSKIPACLQEYEDMIHSAGGWIDDAQSWLEAPRAYNTARSLQNQANTLQMVLDDSERIRATLMGFGPVLEQISAVCHISAMEDRLVQTECQVTDMQQKIMGPLDKLMHITLEVDAIEAEVKTMEKNVTKIRAILSSTDALNVSFEEHLHNRQVILANIQSMRRTVGEIEVCKAELELPHGAEETLTAFSRAMQLLDSLQELEQLTQEQSKALEGKMGEERQTEETVPSAAVCVTAKPSGLTVSSHLWDPHPLGTTSGQKIDPLEACLSEEEEEYDDEDAHSSSSDTLTCSFSEDPDETLMDQKPAEAVAPTPQILTTMSQDHTNAVSKTNPVDMATGSVMKPNGSVTLEIDSGQLQDSTINCQNDLCRIWHLLHTWLSDKLNTLRDFPEGRLHAAAASRGERAGCGFGCLREMQMCTLSLQHLRDRASALSSASSENDGRPVLDTELHKALCGVEHCLETLMDLLLGPTVSMSTMEDCLTLLLMECLSAELPTLVEELNNMSSVVNINQLAESPVTTAKCITCRQACLQTAQSALTSSLNRLETQLGHNQQAEPRDSNVCVYDDMPPGQSGPITHIKDVPVPECVEAVELRRVSQALLQGFASLVEMARERLAHSQDRPAHSQDRPAHSQDRPAHSRTQLHTLISSYKKLFQVIGSQLALVQLLFRCWPHGALVSHEDEVVRLEQQVTALQQQALKQGADMHRMLQDWTQWDEECNRLNKLVDDMEALIPCEGPIEEEEDEEGLLQKRLDACQLVLAMLEESRPALGSVLDQAKALQARGIRTGVGSTGSVLELRWRALLTKAEQENQRTCDIRDNWTRFHKETGLLTEWLGCANEQLKTWLNLPNATLQDEELTRTYLIQLLGFSVELEIRSSEKASALRAGTSLLQLKEAEAPCLRTQMMHLEQTWSEVTSALPRAHERLHQLLLEGWPPCQVLSGLEAWVMETEARLEEQGRETSKASHDADQLRHILQYYQGCQKGSISGHLILDFLCDSGPQAVSDSPACLSEERTLLAERLGALSLSWLLLDGKLGSQMRRAEELFRSCTDREKRLGRVLTWAVRQRERMREWQAPVSQTQVGRALLAWEAVEEELKDVCVEVEELRVLCEGTDRETWSADSVNQVFTELSQQIGSLRPALQQVLDQWSQFDKDLGEVSLHTCRLRFSLKLSSGSLVSYNQVSRCVEHLQGLQAEARNGEEMWASLDLSCTGLRGLVSPGAAQLLIERLEMQRSLWKAVVQEVDEELSRMRNLLSGWQEYSLKFEHCAVNLKRLQDQWQGLLSSLSTPPHATGALVDAIKHQQVRLEDVQSCLKEVLVASKPLTGQMEPLVTSFIKSETRLLSHDLVLLSQALSKKQAQLQEELDQRNTISSSMESLEPQLGALYHMLNTHVCNMDSVKSVLIELRHLRPALDDLTESSFSLTLDDPEADRLQALTRKWAQVLTCASHMYRDIQAEAQHSQSFEQKWGNWMSFQEKMEEDLKPDISGHYSGLCDQLAIHQTLRIEVLAGDKVFRELISNALISMEDTSEEERPDLTLKLVEMRERWQGVVSAEQQRRSLVQNRLAQWRFVNRCMKRLMRLLRDIEVLLPPATLALCTLQRLPGAFMDLKRVEETLLQQDVLYRQTLEVGGLLHTWAEPHTLVQIQRDLETLQEAWDHTRELLGERKTLLESVVQNWSRCQTRLADSAHRLEQLRDRLNQPLPAMQEELQCEEKLTEEDKASLELWTGGMKELSTMKTDLSQYILSGDATLLQGQVEQLHCQWEELCLKVSLRRQEIADRLSAWTIFNDKNKELCDWLTQMENKVSHSGDLSLGEMLEKLKKDCMEEINLFSENKSHLKQLGEQLMLASDRAKQDQLHGTLRDVSDRWQHLFKHIEARVKKLKETLVTMQQLDKNMSNLRSWLSGIETQLAMPVTYSMCHHQEIQRQLAQQQELQRDIEQHTEGVASVLTLCDALLHDEDVCGGDSDPLQQTSRSLDQRWRAICATSLERRLRIEETWRLWCKFLDDYSRFEDWLKVAESTAANPNSENVLYTVAKEELKMFEGFQRQVQERLTQLELVNNQYRRLARENRTDGASCIKAMVHEGNRRWEALHRRTAAILRRLKHFTGQREEFEGTRESLLVWLTEMDLQLTNVEHFSETDVQHKIKQLNGFQREITLNTERIDSLIVFGEGLIQRSSPLDAALIEDELEELHSYCQEVFGRVVRFHQRLTQPRVFKEEPKVSGGDTPLKGSCELIGRPWLRRSQSQGSVPATPTHLLVPPMEGSGRETPVSVCDSIPLEWDHTGDVGGSSSQEDEEEIDKEEGIYYCALSVPLRSTSESPSWHSPGSQDRRSLRLESTDSRDPLPTHSSTPLKQGYVHLMSECSGSIRNVKRVSLILDNEEQPEEQGLTGLTTADKQAGVIERWELLQAQARSNLLPGPREPQQLTSDLCEVTSWLGQVMPELEKVLCLGPPTSIQDMEDRVKQLKEMQKAFAHYKGVMLSLNLAGRQLQECGSPEARELEEGLARMNQDWGLTCTSMEEWEDSLRTTLLLCREFHETLHSLLLWLAHAESRRYAVDINHPDTPPETLWEHCNTLTSLQEELRSRQSQVGTLKGLWRQLQPAELGGGEESAETQEKLHVTSNKLQTLLRQVASDLRVLEERLDFGTLYAVPAAAPAALQSEDGESEGGSQSPTNASPEQGTSATLTSADGSGEKKDPTPRRSFFYRMLRAAFPLNLLVLLVLVLTCLIPLAENDNSCTLSNNFARSFYPMLRYTNGPPPT